MTVQNNSTLEGAKVVLQSSISTGSQWKISLTASGGYKITPKTGKVNNRVLAVEWVTEDTTANGLDMEQKNYQDNNSYLDEWKFSLLYWNSDEEAGYWNEAPSYYSKKIDTSNTFYFDSGVNSAIDQWGNALSMDFEYETESEADIKIYGASKSFLIDNYDLLDTIENYDCFPQRVCNSRQ